MIESVFLWIVASEANETVAFAAALEHAVRKHAIVVRMP